MSIEYDKYYGVDFAIDFYQELIRNWKTAKPGISSNCILQLVVNRISYSRLLLGAWSSQIAITNELALDIKDTKEGQYIEKLIEKQLDESELLNRIIPKEPLTKKELKQQLKNALSHAEYNLLANDDNTTIIKINSPKIEATFTVSEVAKLAEIYVQNYALTDEYRAYDIYDLITLSINNKQSLEKAIKKVTRKKEEQDIIRDYILYIGLQNFVELSLNDRYKIFVERLAPILNKRASYISSADRIGSIFNYIIEHGNGTVSADDFYKITFEAPFIYTDLLINLGFICLNYIKEAQAKQELPSFNYHNINLNGINYSPSSTVKIVPVAEQQTKLQNQINDLTPAMAKAKAAVKKAEEDIEKLNQNTKIPLQIKQQQYQSRKDSILKNTQKYNELKAKINILQTEYDNAEDYIETNDFFKHLRNSISHGFYRIDYSRGLKDKDLGKIIFHFEDYEIDKDNRSKRKKVFEADITAKRLTAIFESIEKRLINDSNSFDIEGEHNYFVLDTRSDPTKNKEYVKRIEDKVIANGGVIINN